LLFFFANCAQAVKVNATSWRLARYFDPARHRQRTFLVLGDKSGANPGTDGTFPNFLNLDNTGEAVLA
jgi:hypothetical protein